MTTAGGVLTLVTKTSWWAYAMAAVCITAFLSYCSILAQPEPVAAGGAISPVPRLACYAAAAIRRVRRDHATPA